MTGGCLCGGVRFELTERAPAAGYCHCTRCQRRTGTAASAQARIDGRSFRLLAGESLVKAWRHPQGGFEKCFCSECGAHLFSRDPDDPTQMSIRMGAFDGDPGVRPSWRTYGTGAQRARVLNDRWVRPETRAGQLRREAHLVVHDQDTRPRPSIESGLHTALPSGHAPDDAAIAVGPDWASARSFC